MMRLFRRPTALRVTARSADTPTTRAVNLRPGDTYIFKGDGRTIFKLLFTPDDGLEVVMVAPFITADPASLRRWADFTEENQ